MTITDTLFNPFPGLRSFEEGEDHLFFGRETQIDELLRKLSKEHFLAVVGSSGSGKSSLVKSGLLPSLHAGYMASAGSTWNLGVFRPGRDPIGNMASALASLEIMGDGTEDAERYTPILEVTLRRSRRGLVDVREQSNLGARENLLLVVDQFEELFRYHEHGQEGQRDDILFINLLLFACQQKDARVFIVLTMRSDFLGECTEFRGLPEAINQSQYLIPRMTRDQRKAAITGPIAVGGGTITPRLVTRLLNDVGDNPDQLPILQHALMRTWEYWEKASKGEGALDIAHYEAIGTMKEALSLHAEEAFAELSDNHHKNITGTIFKALTDRGESGQGIRRPIRVKELCELTEVSQEVIVRIINLFRTHGRSFLMPPLEVALTSDTIIDISHESLMRIWVRLIQWVKEENQASEIYLRLSGAAALHQEGEVALWRGPELELALRWKEETHPSLVWAQRYDPAFERAISFLNHSEKQRDLELAKRNRRQQLRLKRARIVAIVIGVIGMLSMVLSFVAYDQKLQADQQRSIAEKQTLLANRKEKEAVAERKIAEEQQRIAERNAQEAQRQKQRAERERIKALLAKDEAENQRRQASQQRKQAVKAKNEAIAQRTIANERRIEAELAHTEAVNQRKAANQLRNLAESRNIAYQAQHLLAEGDYVKSAGEAIRAYEMNRTNGGSVNSQEIYQALRGALLALKPNTYKYKQHHNEIRQLAVHPKQPVLASADNGGEVHILRISTGEIEQVAILHGASRLRSLNYSPDGKYLLTGSYHGQVSLWKANEPAKYPTPLSTLSLNGAVNQIAFVQLEGQWSPLFRTRDTLFVGAIREQQLLVTKRKPFPHLGAMATDQAGTSLAVGSANNLLLFHYDSEDRSIESVSETIRLQKDISALAISPDGTYVAAGQKDGRLAVLSLKHPELERGYFTAHQSMITSINFYVSAQQLQIATTSLDHSAKLLNVEALSRHQPEEGLITLKGHEKWIRSGQLSRDGKYLFTAGADRQVGIWNCEVEQMVHDLKQLLDADSSPLE